MRAFTIAALAMVVLPTASSADPVSSPPSDPLGDVPAGPDVTQVAVLHPMTSGPLIFTVSVANEPVLVDGSVIELRLDTDMDASTGSANGVERLVHRLWTGSTRLCSWTATGVSCASSPFVSSTYVDGSSPSRRRQWLSGSPGPDSTTRSPRTTLPTSTSPPTRGSGGTHSRRPCLQIVRDGECKTRVHTALTADPSSSTLGASSSGDRQVAHQRGAERVTGSHEHADELTRSGH